MNRFDPNLRRLARARRQYWQRTISCAVAGCFRRKEWGKVNRVRRWLLVEVCGQELRGPGHYRVDAVEVSVGLPVRRRRSIYTPRIKAYAKTTTPYTRERIAVLARTASVHEAWLALHGKDPS